MMTENSLELPSESNLIVRAIHHDDTVDFFNLIDANRTYLRDWLAWLDFMESIETARKHIESRKKLAAEKAGFCFVVIESQKMVGIVHLVNIDHQNKQAMIGYWIGQTSAGKGLATKATKSVMNFAFNDLKLHRLEIRCATNNVSSRAVAEKLGFKHESTLRDSEWLHDKFINQELYSCLSNDNK